ncbi:MAG: ferrous iron transport protein B [Limisphaerales bacterium]|jgi:ferrous iron transport protein B
MSSTDGKKSTSDISYVALTGNPNCGKTTIFNSLTGLRAKVGNYAGVTVERKEGKLRGVDRSDIMIIDLPGTYSLSPKSIDEQISRDILFHRLDEVPAPTAVVVVIDGSNLERNLYYATQVIELGYPTLIALNMMDVAEQNGHTIDEKKLAQELGVEIVPMVANENEGMNALRDKIAEVLKSSTAAPKEFAELPEPFAKERAAIAEQLEGEFKQRHTSAVAEALLVLSDEKAEATHSERYPAAIQSAIKSGRERLDQAGIDWRCAAIEARYARIGEIHDACVEEEMEFKETYSDKLDQVLTHKVWGLAIFVAIMAAMFQGIFTISEWPMNWLESGVGMLGNVVGGFMPEGDLRSLLVDGVIMGVGAVVVFLPQICLLFLFIGILEDTGYMSRAAFLMDRLMSKVGLHGKSFIPMLSSFGCAIPGIMATRTIENPKDRLVTILVAPLMSCSARLPVYTVLIAACVPDIRVGGMGLQGLTMLAMYLLGIIVALLMAWLFKKTLLKGDVPMLIMELPPYKKPVALALLRHMWERSKIFLRRAGTVILGISILLWFLATYPRNSAIDERFAEERATTVQQAYSGLSNDDVDSKIDELAALHSKEGSPVTAPTEIDSKVWEELAALNKAESGEKLRTSFAGRLGQLIEPVIKPLGMDWKIGIGLVASFAAREVFVSTMSTVYNVGEVDDSDSGTRTLAQTLREQTWPDGSPIYTTLVAVTLMVFYVFAMQCVSTIAVVRRETNGWKWPIFQFVYMTALAYVLALITYHGGKLLGWG